MAVTYGSTNLGSSANGAFGIYSATTTGAEAISVLQADFATNVVSAVTSAVPLTALQTAALSTLLAKLRTAVPAASTLSVLRKLVGVLSMTDGVALALSVTSVGAVHTLVATTSAAGNALVYVPNAAASGLYSGSNSDTGDAPSGAAGGDLSGTYPDPDVSGLQGDVLAAKVANGFVKRNAANNAWEEVAYGSAANTVCQGDDSRLSNSRAPNGAAGGALQGTYPNPLIADGVIPYDFMLPLQRQAAPLGALFIFQTFIATRDFTLAAVGEQQNFRALTAPAAPYVISVFVTPPGDPAALLATISFGAGSQDGVFAFVGPDISFLAGSIITFIGQNPDDAAFEGLVGTLKANVNY